MDQPFLKSLYYWDDARLAGIAEPMELIVYECCPLSRELIERARSGAHGACLCAYARHATHLWLDASEIGRLLEEVTNEEGLGRFVAPSEEGIYQIARVYDCVIRFELHRIVRGAALVKALDGDGMVLASFSGGDVGLAEHAELDLGL
jgi:hypothetical protein